MSRSIALRPLASVLLLSGVLVLAGCGGGNSATPTPKSSPLPTVAGTPVELPSSQLGNGSGITLNDIACDAGSHQGGVVVKATLTVTVAGQSIRPSGNLGVTAKCTYWLHTNAGGDLIFDAPAGTTLKPTLMDFFSIIRNANDSDPYDNYFASAVNGGTITINGKADTEPWGNVVIHDGDQIVISHT